MASDTGVRGMPNDWDRGGLPAWTYDNEELLELEKEVVFRRNWLCVGHVSEIPEPGDYLSLDAADERALILWDRDCQIRAFHNLCRHRTTPSRGCPEPFFRPTVPAPGATCKSKSLARN